SLYLRLLASELSAALPDALQENPGCRSLPPPAQLRESVRPHARRGPRWASRDLPRLLGCDCTASSGNRRPPQALGASRRRLFVPTNRFSENVEGGLYAVRGDLSRAECEPDSLALAAGQVSLQEVAVRSRPRATLLPAFPSRPGQVPSGADRLDPTGATARP